MVDGPSMKLTIPVRHDQPAVDQRSILSGSPRIFDRNRLIRRSILWFALEIGIGRTEARKDRPGVVVLAIRRSADQCPRVRVVPINPRHTTRIGLLRCRPR
jgi:hypothetical protein